MPTTEDDGGSFTSVAVPLERHLLGVEGFARRFAEALALPPGVTGDVALAGYLHDVGKADPRFQMMLHGGDPVAEAVAEEPLAKSAVPAHDRAARERARERSGYPRRARHELMSVALVQASDSLRERARDWDLVLHLVAAHHGHCRPFAPPVLDPHPVDVRVTIGGVALMASSDHGLVRIDSGVAERFWDLVRRYGWWGVSWLEAIVRLADHRESEQEASHVG